MPKPPYPNSPVPAFIHFRGATFSRINARWCCVGGNFRRPRNYPQPRRDAGRKPGRVSDVEITIYKAMGIAMEDMGAANLAQHLVRSIA